MLDAAIPTAAVGAVTFIIFHYQSRQEKSRDAVLKQIKLLNDKYDKIQRYSVQGPLVKISNESNNLREILDRRSLQKFDVDDTNKILSSCNTIKYEADVIRGLIGAIYEELQTALNYVMNSKHVHL